MILTCIEIGLENRGRIKQILPPAKDSELNFYTLVLRADNTYSVSLNAEELASGEIAQDFEFEHPLTE